MNNWKSLSLETIESMTSGGVRPRLLLHSCCAPCSSYTLEYLSPLFDITVFFYNPNIAPSEEYSLRLSEQRRLIAEMFPFGGVSLIEGEYSPEAWLSSVSGFEYEAEGGARCEICIRERLLKTARLAKDSGFDCFSTTLTISPHKHADMINSFSLSLERDIGIRSLPLDLKKNNGYKRSIELSKKYGLYRQNFCGCPFSK
jgi:predicted adenine nucleotide alpha hydrolase (AANH) superfamily ATPase